MKTALIFGVSGQDGAYLSRLLLDKQYVVHGTSRDAHQPFPRLRAVGVDARIVMHQVAPLDREGVRNVVAQVRPDEIYNLSGLSSVALSFAEPATAWASILDAHVILLEAVRSIAGAARIYHSASSDCFGDTPVGTASDEDTPFAPLSPYAEAKAAAYRANAEYRATRGLHASSGIVFNHESPLRSATFVTQKIVSSAAAIAAGRGERLALGDLSPRRDWGYAPEYVEAMWLMLQQKEPRDYVIATGESHSIEDLAAAAFAEFGLDYREHVTLDAAFARPADIRYNRGNPSRAGALLGWHARTKFSALVRVLADAARRTHPATGPGHPAGDDEISPASPPRPGER